MPQIDTETGCLRLRLVYDGAAEAGKTATLEALSRSLGAEMITPGEREGRTLYFDWVEHTAGRFGGRPIQCQLVAVPGQPALAARRRRILEDADVIVFVVDTRESALAASQVALEECLDYLVDSGRQVPMLLQLNKRDMRTAIAVSDLDARLTGDHEWHETSATEGTGVRETFVAAVRAALARVRELDSLGHLEAADAGSSSPNALLAELDLEDDELRPELSVASRRTSSSSFDELARQRFSSNVTPDLLTPVGEGTVWPPVEGRLLLSEALREDISWLELGALRARGETRNWSFATDETRSFDTPELARPHLIAWAREHVKLVGLISTGRALALLPTFEEGVQIWEVVRKRKSLEDELTALEWSGYGADETIDRFDRLWAAGLQAVLKASRAGRHLPLGLNTVAADPDEPPYLGLLGITGGRHDWSPLLSELRTKIESLATRMLTRDQALALHAFRDSREPRSRHG